MKGTLALPTPRVTMVCRRKPLTTHSVKSAAHSPESAGWFSPSPAVDAHQLWSLPLDLCTRVVEHNHNRARTRVIFGIAGDIPSDTGAAALMTVASL